MRKKGFVWPILIMLVALLAGCGQQNMFEKGNIVKNVELVEITYIGETALWGFDKEGKEFRVSLPETIQIEQTVSKIRFSGEVTYKGDTLIIVEVNKQKDIKILDNKRDPSIYEEPAQEEIDEQVRQEAMAADYDEINAGNWLNKKIFVEGTVEAIEENVLWRLTLLQNENKYIILVYGRMPNIEDALAVLQEGDRIKIYGSVKGKDETTGLPTVFGNIMEIVE